VQVADRERGERGWPQKLLISRTFDKSVAISGILVAKFRFRSLGSGGIMGFHPGRDSRLPLYRTATLRSQNAAASAAIE
jgi:hypothetical protein